MSRDDLARYQAAACYLNEGLIRRGVEADGPRPLLTRRQRMAAFLPRLEHPERSFRAVHVAGTSGKGSICVMLAELLRAAGVRTGLHVTPYLQVFTEKLWVDGRYASAEELGRLVDWIRPHAEAERGPDVPMHGMASVAITLEHFRRQRVELGVVEVGVGGRHDLTTVLDTAVAVVGAIGLDHLKTLGPTLEEIAWHKAGIIVPGCRAVVLDGPGRPAAQREAARHDVPLRIVDRSCYGLRAGPGGRPLFNYTGRRLALRDLELAMPGPFQAENAALALAALEELELDQLSAPALGAALSRARLPGRGEILPRLRPESSPVLLDGAHNADKLAAFAGTLAEHGGRRLHVLYGGLHGRTPDQALRELAARAATFVVTRPPVYGKQPRPLEEVAASLDRHPALILEPDAGRALDRILEVCSRDDLLVVTGSIYLVGALRGRWYADEQVLLERTSWPSVTRR